jgi:hypothetical protein
MRVQHIAALAALAALSCAILPGCLQSPEVDAKPSSIERVSEPGGPEAVGEASQPMGRVPQEFGSKDFPFVVQIKDDGKDPGGGWQRSITTLTFSIYHGAKAVYTWDCPIEIGMPIRSKGQGTISPSRASLWTAQAANAAVDLVRDSRDDPDEWIGVSVLFCRDLYTRMQGQLNSNHKWLGATVAMGSNP